MVEAWESQSKRLIEVQKKGGTLEKYIRDFLEWKNGRVIYDPLHDYDIQVDNLFPSVENPEVIASVTYTEPDTKGHSNENKLQLKVGELALIKHRFPNCKVILIIGGSKESWLPYVLKAFELFFDEVVHISSEEGFKRLQKIKKKPTSVTTKHSKYWASVSKEWNEIQYKGDNFNIPNGLLRYKVIDKIKALKPPVGHPDLVNSRVAALCLNRSRRKKGKEWKHFTESKWSALEQSRSYFNPLEAVVELTLSEHGYKFQGGIAMDVAVPSFLHELGMKNTLLSEDFVLFSQKEKKYVYIQCKSSGGGRTQHGKNIQNRGKEQITRGLLYRSTLKKAEFTLKSKNFIWISVLDGNWNLPRKSPLKYIHMLQHAGYDYFIGSEALVDQELNPLKDDANPLNKLLNELECTKE